LAQVTVIGAGYMGSAMCWPLRDNGHQIRLVGTPLDAKIIRSCREASWHPKLKRALPDGVEPLYAEQLEQALHGAQLVIQGVSSAGVPWFAGTIGPRLRPDLPVLSITKGLALAPDGTLQTLPGWVDSSLPTQLRGHIPLAAVGGPCIAGELAGRRPSCVVFTGREASLLDRLASMLRTDYYHIWTSTDVPAVETCVALKNGFTLGIALALGMLDRQGGPDAADARMHNLAATLFAQATLEMERIVQLMGGDPVAVRGLPGVGDLFVTVQGGRSVAIGRLLGSGRPLAEALHQLEGVTLESVDVIRVLGKALPVYQRRKMLRPKDLPLVHHLIEIVVEGKPVNLPLDLFFRG
jgi:glycerol-3-phosphate dehydrogenase (NAD(P)+)